MLFKLSIAALKSKSKDYIILLSGLVIAISIFLYVPDIRSK